MKNVLGWEVNPNKLMWWAKPHSLVLMVIIPILWLCHTLNENDFFAYGQNYKYLGIGSFVFGTLALLGFSIASAIGFNKKL